MQRKAMDLGERQVWGAIASASDTMPLSACQIGEMHPAEEIPYPKSQRYLRQAYDWCTTPRRIDCKVG
jgi:hypothetical protein